jgi:capsid protein
VQYVTRDRSGRLRSSTHDESVERVLQAYTQSLRESARQCSRETGYVAQKLDSLTPFSFT